MVQENQPTLSVPTLNENPQVMQSTPVSPAQASIAQTQQNFIEPKPARTLVRCLAFFVDLLIISLGVVVPLEIASVLLRLINSYYFGLINLILQDFLFVGPAAILLCLYFIIFTYESGSTVGKRLLGLKVVYVDNPESKLKFGRVLIREFPKVFIIYTGYFYIVKLGVIVLATFIAKMFPSFRSSYVLPIIIRTISLLIFYLFIYKVLLSFKAGNRGLQDLLAGTRVVVVKVISRGRMILIGLITFFLFALLIFILSGYTLVFKSGMKDESSNLSAEGKAGTENHTGPDPWKFIPVAIDRVPTNPVDPVAGNNTLRSTNAFALVNAISRYRADHNGAVPPGIDTVVRTITDSGAPSTVDLCVLIPRYFQWNSIPIDPVTGVENPKDSVCTDPGADYNSGYTVVLDPVSNKVTVSAPGAEAGRTISATEY